MLYRTEYYYAWEGEPTLRLTLEGGLGENEWNVYKEEWNADERDYEEVDVAFFDSLDWAQKFFNEQCDIIEGQGFHRFYHTNKVLIPTKGSSSH